jgi:hypothetical protein
MFTIARKHSISAAITRRGVLSVGGLSLLGLDSLRIDADELAAFRTQQRSSQPARETSCIFLFLFGGPSQIDLWDMKPTAPVEIRGEFSPVATNVPGIQVCEHLPLLAQQMDKLCLVRSMSHRMPVHGPACSELYTGRPYFGPPKTDQATPEDWPSIASFVARYGQRPQRPAPSVVLPWYSQFAGQDKRIAGQTGGRMGELYSPFLVQGDPNAPGFDVPGIGLPGELNNARLQARRELLRNVDQLVPVEWSADHDVQLFRNHVETAFAMLGSSRTQRALEVERELPATRDRYGRTKMGQSLLLARRLVESGVSLVTVNWDDGTQTDKVSPFWDTHNHNFASLKDRLAPLFDRAFSALIDDLHERGLLETTLVVAVGEFGRTPKIGQIVQNGMTEKSGRDHWPHAFTALLAGGRVRGGQAYGATNRIGAFVDDRPVSPADLSATILDHLGIAPDREYWDHFQQLSRRLSEGRVIRDLG